MKDVMKEVNEIDVVGDAWYRRSASEVLEHLSSSRAGLDRDEVDRRRREHGPNRLGEQETISAWRVLLEQFTSPLIYVLIGALVITLAIEDYADALVVAIVLAVNATIGFVQEYRASTAVQALLEMVSPEAKVRRGDHEQYVDADDVVPGDIVLLEPGEVVPADVRLMRVRGLRIDESALTGESVPADKVVDPIEEDDLTPADQRNTAFMGTAVSSGDGEGVVVATGSRTQIGRISEQIQEAGTTETPLQMRIERLAKRITAAILVVALVAFGVGIVLGRGVTEMLLLAVALAVSAIPAGLPVVVTVALATGVSRMARRHALIRRLPAVETLGSCTTIISDKTGTLTQNRMTVESVIAGDRGFQLDVAGDHERFQFDGEVPDLDDARALRETLLVGALCNDATTADEGDEGSVGDPMEIALLIAAGRQGLDRDELSRRHPRRDTVPFRNERRYMATIHDVSDEAEAQGPLVLVKGAPERVVEMCDRRRTDDGGDEPIDHDEVVRRGDELARQGYRVLAMAVGRGEDAALAVRDRPGGMVFVGMQGLVDPPRDSAVDAVDRCHDAGIRVIMVTGDHAATAAAIGHQVHVDRRADLGSSRDTGEVSDAATPEVRTGQQMADMTDDELDEALGDVNVFARVAPEQKRRIIERLKFRDEIVAVTGDGVNDAPALKSAHLGAAMGSGTDVAKEASDMVITDDDFASVYAAVEEGRTSFRNIRMATFFLLSTGAAEVLIIVAALGLDWPLPLLPAQILWMNVVTNGVADVALAFEPGEKELFRRPPRSKDEGILDQRLLERLVIVGVWLAVATLAVFYWQWSVREEDLVAARTTALTTIVLFQKVHVFNCRSEDVSIFRKSLFANKVLLLAFVSLALHIGAMYVPWTQELLEIAPMSMRSWLVAIGVAVTAIPLNEVHKRFRHRTPAR